MTREKGKIIKWNDEKGFGFILPFHSNENIFVHIKSFTDTTTRPAENQNVTYTIFEGDDRKKSAIKVSRATDNPVRNSRHKNRTKNINSDYISMRQKNLQSTTKSTYDFPILYTIMIISFMLFLFYWFREGVLPIVVIFIYITMGIITYFVYAQDKKSAISNERRTSEQFLLSLSLFGGWMGALIAQQKFRHKTKKTSFQKSFWATVIFNILFLTSAFKIIHF